MNHELIGLSDGLSRAIASASAFTVGVNGRNSYGSTGIAWGDGVIVSADHTLERDDDITVTLPEGGDTPATLVGRDPANDLAVLRVDCDLPPPPRAGDIQVGTLAVAIGWGTGKHVSASLGIVSAIGEPRHTRGRRMTDGLIRPDLTMYPGYSGGPLVTVSGTLIGINTSRLGGGVLTIPATMVDAVVEQILAHGRIRRSYLGLTSQPVRLAPEQAASAGQETALVVVGVEEGSPSEVAGIIVGDVLTEFDDQPIRDTDDLRTGLSAAAAGKQVSVCVIRGHEVRQLAITVGER